MKKLKQFIEFEAKGWKRWEVIWLIVATIIITGLSIYWGDNWFGITSALTGVWSVILTGKGKRSCYIVGLINTLMYAWIAYGSKYYGEVMLNALYYVPMQFIGWYAWSKHMSEETTEVEKVKMSNKNVIIWTIISISAVVIYGFILDKMGGNLPYFDSFTTSLSVIAMIFSVKRYASQWLLWILVDVVTVYLWISDYMLGNDNIATLLMWSVYLLNAIFMYVKWNRESK